MVRKGMASQDGLALGPSAGRPNRDGGLPTQRYVPREPYFRYRPTACALAARWWAHRERRAWAEYCASHAA